jgi:lysine-specific demethylase 3
MYNALATKQDEHHHGSTKLHMDMTDAVNIMLWTKGSAVWHIFSAKDAPTLRDFLRDDVGYRGPGDSIHSQGIYITPAMLDRLQKKHNICPYTITQRCGEAVFIPAGCTHQV